MPLRQPTATIAPKPIQMMLTNPPPTATAKTTPILTATMIAMMTPSMPLSPTTLIPSTTSPTLQAPSPLRNSKTTQSRLRPTSSRTQRHQRSSHPPPLPNSKQYPDHRQPHPNVRVVATHRLPTYQLQPQPHPTATVKDRPKPLHHPNRLRRFPSQRLTSNSTTPRCRHLIHPTPSAHQPAHPQYHPHPQDTAKAFPSEGS